MVDTSLTSINESIRAFRQQLDLLQLSPIRIHSTPRRTPDSVFLPRFSGDDPAVWVHQAEKYFAFHNILSEHKLSLASFYFDGTALEWYRWLFHNKQLAGWDHFVEKLFIRFRSRARDTRHDFLPIPKQHEAVEYYPTVIANLPSSQYLNEHSDCNNPSLAHRVFKEMSDGENNHLKDVESMMSAETQVCHLAEQGNISVSLHIFAENSEVDHMFDKMPEKHNEVDSLDSTFVGSNTEMFGYMDNNPSLMLSPLLSVVNQMVTDQNLSNNITKDEAIGFPNKVLSEPPQFGNEHSSREGRQNVRTIFYETAPPQESTNLLLSTFGMLSDRSMNIFPRESMNTFFLREVVGDAQLVEAITATKYRKVVVIGGEYNDFELLDDLELLAKDEEAVKHFRISTRRVFDNGIWRSCVNDLKVRRSLIGDPNFSWTVIFKEFVSMDVDKTFSLFTNIYLLVDDISTTGFAIGCNARFALLQAGMGVHSTHQNQPQDSKVVQNGNNSEMVITTSNVNWTRTHQIAFIAKRMNTSVFVAAESYKLTCLMPQDSPKAVPALCLTDFSIPSFSLVGQLIRYFNLLNQELLLRIVKLCTNPLLQALSYKHHLSGVCCRDICHVRCVMVLVKVGQYVKEALGVLPNSLISKESITSHFASDHLDHFLWLLLLDDGLLTHFPLVTLQHVEIATIQIIEKVMDECHDLNLEDKVLNWDGGIVMNQVQPNIDTKLTQVIIGLPRVIGLSTSIRATLIWDPD